MQMYVERDFYGMVPRPEEHTILMRALKMHLERHNRGAILLQPPVKARVEHYIGADQEIPRIGIRMEWPTLIPVINSMTYILETKRCPAGSVENAQQMLARLSLTGHEYISDFLDPALEPHLADVVDPQFFEVRVD